MLRGWCLATDTQREKSESANLLVDPIEKEMQEEMGPKKPLVFAYYVTCHGFGHATRVAEVVRNLILLGHEIHVVTAASEHIFTTEIESPKLFIRKVNPLPSPIFCIQDLICLEVLLDIGAIQTDALTVDRLAFLEKVISGVPEGKGVSSSAAIEVATMSAVAASHGLDIAPRDLALLCQKVENHVVGAPCGVVKKTNY
ncbi:L-arabinokinase-like isoform X1 [Salvia splendens]|uniref:L-arabinokinase-like isoform X1 n=1 Tax=Salvia splendens TaxID=180675 RepID=UPI001C25C6EE|nr:L-arabinokinase-like isoform X1 [Salvia splendens]